MLRGVRLLEARPPINAVEVLQHVGRRNGTPAAGLLTAPLLLAGARVVGGLQQLRPRHGLKRLAEELGAPDGGQRVLCVGFELPWR